MGEIVEEVQSKWELTRDGIDGWHWDRDFLRIERELMDECPNEKIYCYQLYRKDDHTPNKKSHVWQFPDLPTAKRVGNILLTT